MSVEKFDVRREILTAISKTDDHTTKTVLLLLLGVLEEIGGKMDAMMQTEMRKAVLNGHEVNHHSHHDWVQARMKDGCEDACAWSRRKMVDEEKAAAESEKDTRANKRAAVEAVIR
jgi:hypothetical protein